MARTLRRMLLAALAGSALAASATEPIRIVTEEFPPYNMTDKGKVTGLSTEVVEAVLREIGEPANIQSMPWARAYEIALNAPNVLIYSITRTAQREPLFKWVGAIAPSDWYLFARRGSTATLTSLDEAKALQTATVNTDAGEQYLVSKGFVIGKNLQSSNKYEFNYEKLRLGRVDLWVANDLVAHYLSRQAGDNPDTLLVRALHLPDLGNNDGQFMAFSLKTPDSTVERFRQGLATIKRNGTYERLKKKWL
ncbi:MAG: transporter substrate-binding domain-containing protein [Burkholderiales bacterium]